MDPSLGHLMCWSTRVLHETTPGLTETLDASVCTESWMELFHETSNAWTATAMTAISTP